MRTKLASVAIVLAVRIRVLVVLIAVSLAVSTGFGSARAAAPAFTSWTETFVDHSRPAPPVWLVTLHGADHYTQWADDPTPYQALDEHLTTDFWDATLKDKKAALSRLQRDATVNGLSSIESRR